MQSGNVSCANLCILKLREYKSYVSFLPYVTDTQHIAVKKD